MKDETDEFVDSQPAVDGKAQHWTEWNNETLSDAFPQLGVSSITWLGARKHASINLQYVMRDPGGIELKLSVLVQVRNIIVSHSRLSSGHGPQVGGVPRVI